MTYTQFAQGMTDSINDKAMRTADSLVTLEHVMSMDICIRAYQATLSLASFMAQNV